MINSATREISVYESNRSACEDYIVEGTLPLTNWTHFLHCISHRSFLSADSVSPYSRKLGWRPGAAEKDLECVPEAFAVGLATFAPKRGIAQFRARDAARGCSRVPFCGRWQSPPANRQAGVGLALDVCCSRPTFRARVCRCYAGPVHERRR
jgi:hypothetical protein